jgi:protein-S-isoprenylcysteine O-methyltransferase Ste14
VAAATGEHPVIKGVRGREARLAGPASNLARTLGQAAVFWLAFFAGLPAGLFALEEGLGLSIYRFASAGWRTAGVLVFLIAGCLNLATAVVMSLRGHGTPLPAACARELVTAGPYRYVRNPMAMSALAQGAGVGLYLGSPLVLLYVAAGAVMWHFIVRPWEEEDLEQRFGEPYRRYRASVRCWIPNLSPYRPGRDDAP